MKAQVTTHCLKVVFIRKNETRSNLCCQPLKKWYGKKPLLTDLLGGVLDLERLVQLMAQLTQLSLRALLRSIRANPIMTLILYRATTCRPSFFC